MHGSKKTLIRLSLDALDRREQVFDKIVFIPAANMRPTSVSVLITKLKPKLKSP